MYHDSQHHTRSPGHNSSWSLSADQRGRGGGFEEFANNKHFPPILIWLPASQDDLAHGNLDIGTESRRRTTIGCCATNVVNLRSDSIDAIISKHLCGKEQLHYTHHRSVTGRAHRQRPRPDSGLQPSTSMFDIDAQCAKAIATLDQLTNAATPVEGVPAEDKQKHVHGTLTLKGDEISHAAGA